MAEEKMTLVEKLQNPQRNDAGQLDEAFTVETMQEAADFISAALTAHHTNHGEV